MLLLGIYLFIALFFSFLCSIAESVLLSISSVHIALLEKEGHKAGPILHHLKSDINKPLAAILTLNTVAHTVGAAGVGAQASVVFGDTSLGIVSAILTLLILFLSEIIPKTLGASHWKKLAPATAHGLKFLVWVFMPVIKVSELVTRSMTKSDEKQGYSRNEFSIMAQLSAKHGHIDKEEAAILQNLLLLQDRQIKDVMTPSTVIFSDSQNLRVEEFFHKHKKVRFSRILIYNQHTDDIVGFVLRTDLLLAQARGNINEPLKNYQRDMPTLLETMSLSHAMKEMLAANTQLMLIVNEYGTVRGILTLEDLLETLIGKEIIDEGDKDADMQKVAKKLWKAKVKKFGYDAEEHTLPPEK